MLTASSPFSAATASPREFVPNASQQVASPGYLPGSDLADSKYKTELCKNWVENASCNYGQLCQFAHGVKELQDSPLPRRKRTQNCRVFYKTGQCMNGDRCIYRHEHRSLNVIARHYYTSRLYTYESLYELNTDKDEFVNHHETGVRKLSVFEAIHDQTSDDEESTASEGSSFI